MPWKLIGLVAWLLTSLYLVEARVTMAPDGPAAIHCVLLCSLGLATVEILNLVIRASLGRNDPGFAPSAAERVVIAVSFALVWGRHVFANFLWYDELLYPLYGPSYDANPSQWIRELWAYMLSPLNDHFMPVGKLVTYGLFSVSASSYAPWAFASFTFGMFSLYGLFLVVRSLTSDRLSGAAAVFVTVAAGLFTSAPLIFVWKGCGFGPSFTMAVFVLLLLLAVSMRNHANTRGRLLLAVGVGAVVPYCSSLMTIPAAVLAPLGAGDGAKHSGFRRKLAIVLLVSAASSVAYWLARSHFHVHSQVRSFAADFVWNCMGYVLYYIGLFALPQSANRALAWTLLAGLVIADSWLTVRALRRRDRVSLGLWGLLNVGMLMWLQGSAQTYFARHPATFDLHVAPHVVHTLYGYHCYLPSAGLAFASAAALAAGLAVIRSERVRMCGAPWLTCALIVLTLKWLHFTHYLPNATGYPMSPEGGRTKGSVVSARTELNQTLWRVFGRYQNQPSWVLRVIPVPDFPMRHLVDFDRYYFAPSHLLRDDANWLVPLSVLYRLSGMRASPHIVFKPSAEFCEADMRVLMSETELVKFLEHYYATAWSEMRGRLRAG